MKSLYLLVVFLAVLHLANASAIQHLHEWTKFVQKYNKTYATPSETKLRYDIFTQTVDTIEAHNARDDVTYKMSINQFADLTNQEFKREFLGYQRRETVAKKGVSFKALNRPTELPESWDWRAKGAVTPIVDQGECSSSWAFAAVGAIEGCHFVTTGKLVQLSVQQVIDCVHENQGCDGGLPSEVLNYTLLNGGIDAASCYPYSGESGQCRYNVSCCASTLGDYFTIVDPGSEIELQEMVYLAPSAIAINAGLASFQMYSSGVYSDPSCNEEVDHECLVVGWGVDPSAGPFWIVKNSWGTDWGMDGYILIARNHHDMCGVAIDPIIAVNCGDC